MQQALARRPYSPGAFGLPEIGVSELLPTRITVQTPPTHRTYWTIEPLDEVVSIPKPQLNRVSIIDELQTVGLMQKFDYLYIAHEHRKELVKPQQFVPPATEPIITPGRVVLPQEPKQPFWTPERKRIVKETGKAILVATAKGLLIVITLAVVAVVAVGAAAVMALANCDLDPVLIGTTPDPNNPGLHQYWEIARWVE